LLYCGELKPNILRHYTHHFVAIHVSDVTALQGTLPPSVDRAPAHRRDRIPGPQVYTLSADCRRVMVLVARALRRGRVI